MFGKLLDSALNVFNEATNTLGNAANDALDTTSDYASTAIDTASDYAADTLDTASDYTSTAVDAFSDYANDVFEVADETFDTATDYAINTIELADDWVNDSPIVEVAEPALEAVNNVVQNVGEVITEFVESIAGTAAPIVEGANDVLQDAGETIAEAVAPVVEAVINTVQDAGAAVAESVEPIVEEANDILQDAGETVVEAAAPVVEAVTNTVQDTGETIADFVEPIVEAVAPVVEAVANTVQDAGEEFAEFVEPAVESLTDVVCSGVNAFTTIYSSSQVDAELSQDASIESNASYEVNDALSTNDESLAGKYTIGKNPPSPYDYNETFSEQPDTAVHQKTVSFLTKGAFWVAAKALQYDLPDATSAYLHYQEGDGADRSFSYDKYVNDDISGEVTLKNLIYDTQGGAENLYQQIITQSPELANQEVTFNITSDMIAPAAVKEDGDNLDEKFPYPSTENWQKALGSHAGWVEATISVTPRPDEQPPVYKVNFNLHAEDRYDFNKGQRDIRSFALDNWNGNLETDGLAKGYMNRAALNREIIWTEGNKENPSVSGGNNDCNDRRAR